MKTIAVSSYRREGNDCLLEDTIEIVVDDCDTFIRHTHKVRGGWTENIRDVKEIFLEQDAGQIQDAVDKYLKENFLYEHIKLDLGDYENEN